MLTGCLYAGQSKGMRRVRRGDKGEMENDELGRNNSWGRDEASAGNFVERGLQVVMRGRMVAEGTGDNERRVEMYFRPDSVSGRGVRGESVHWDG